MIQKRLAEYHPDGVCPTCGEEFESRHSMSVHHTKSHGVSIAGTLHVCASCGDIYKRDTNVTDTQFCSADCFTPNSWRPEPGKDHPRYERVEVECEVCGKTEHVIPYRAERYRFCSQTCHGKWMGSVGAPPRAERGQFDCEWCGESFERNINRNANRFCSRRCVDEWMSQRFSGENHHQYNGVSGGLRNILERYLPGGPITEERKETIREKHGRKCGICGGFPESGYSLAIHHIVPLNSGGTNESYNLVPLCLSCHRKTEIYTVAEITSRLLDKIALVQKKDVETDE